MALVTDQIALSFQKAIIFRNRCFFWWIIANPHAVKNILFNLEKLLLDRIETHPDGIERTGESWIIGAFEHFYANEKSPCFVFCAMTFILCGYARQSDVAIMTEFENFLTNRIPDWKAFEITDGEISRKKRFFGDKKTISDKSFSLGSDTFKSIKFKKGEKNIDYDYLLFNFVRHAKIINIIDPYIIEDYQLKNLYDFLYLCSWSNDDNDHDLEINLITKPMESEKYLIKNQKRNEKFLKWSKFFEEDSVHFTWSESKDIHFREILIDDKYEITLDRGLDIFEDNVSRSGKRSTRSFKIIYEKITNKVTN